MEQTTTVLLLAVFAGGDCIVSISLPKLNEGVGSENIRGRSMLSTLSSTNRCEALSKLPLRSLKRLVEVM